MIITDQFVVINFPKTGSTFVRKVFKEIHKEKTSYKIFSKLFGKRTTYEIRLSDNLRDYSVSSRWLKPTPHGMVCQIPKEHSHKKVISVIRNPYNILVSLFEFRDWVYTYSHIEDKLKRDFPNYPDISFTDFLKIRSTFSYFGDHPYNYSFPSIGELSTNFVFFFCKSDPITFLNNWSGETSVRQIKKDLKDVLFLKNEKLNEELYGLLSQTYAKSKISFIKELGKVNSSTPQGRSYSSYYNSENKKYADKELELILELFPEYQEYVYDPRN